MVPSQSKLAICSRAAARLPMKCGLATKVWIAEEALATSSSRSRRRRRVAWVLARSLVAICGGIVAVRRSLQTVCGRAAMVVGRALRYPR